MGQPQCSGVGGSLGQPPKKIKIKIKINSNVNGSERGRPLYT